MIQVAFLRSGKAPPWDVPIVNELKSMGVSAGFIVGSISNQVALDLQKKCFTPRSLAPLNKLLNNSPLSLFMNGIMNIRTAEYSAHFFNLGSKLKTVDLAHVADDVMTPAWQSANLGKKIAMTIWENIPFNPMTTLKKPTSLRWEYLKSRIDAFLPVSEVSKTNLIIGGISEEKITKVHAGIDTNSFSRKFDDETSTRLNPDEKFLILGVGRIVYEKGLTFTLRALKMLKDHSKDFLYLHVGQGDRHFMQYIRKLVGLYNLKQNVKFLGSLPYFLMPKIYSIADVFIMPSVQNMYWEEQMGFSTVEAMSCGVIPIVSDTPSMREVVPENCGFLFPAGNSETLFEKLSSIMEENFTLSNLRSKCIKHIKSNYNAHDTAKAYKMIYEKILN